MRRSVVGAALCVAVLAVSTSGPLVRLSHAPALAIASWRIAFSLVIVGVALLATGTWRQLGRLDRHELGLAAFGGVMLALHFWSWNASVHLTTVAASVLLVNTQPLLVAGLSARWLRERPTLRQWIGIVVALAGAAIVVAPDVFGRGVIMPRPSAVLGDLLAFAGALAAAVYFVVGRRVRAAVDLWPYVAVVYGTCLVTLVIAALGTGTPLLPYPGREIAIFAGLAIGPMLFGHTLLNWALRHTRAYLVNVVLLGEPILATIIAALLPAIHEQPTAWTLAGGAIVLTGIVVAERRPSA